MLTKPSVSVVPSSCEDSEEPVAGSSEVNVVAPVITLVTCTINGLLVNALLDTGSSVSLVRSTDFPHIVVSSLSCSLTSVNNVSLDVSGVSCLTVSIASVEKLHDFVVAKDISHPVILGSDFLSACQGKIDFSRKCLCIGDDCVPVMCHTSSALSQSDPTPVSTDPAPAVCCRVALTENVCIPPSTCVVAAAACVHDCSNEGECLLEALPSVCNNHSVEVSPALVTVQDDGIIPVTLVNFHSDSITLHKDTHVGLLTSSVRIDNFADAQSQSTVSSVNAPELSVLSDVRRTVLDGFLGKQTHLAEPELSSLRELLYSYHDVFILEDSDHGYCDWIPHEINTEDSQPIKERTRRIPFHRRKALESLINQLQDKNIIRESSSPWAAPIVLVEKKDGSMRLCIDYRKLNAVTKPDAYPLPRVDDTLDSLAGCSLFSTLDLATGYWQIAMSEHDREKTAFTSPLGLYEFNVLPMGCRNAPATFQRLMEQVLHGLTGSVNDNVCRVFFDDVSVATKSVAGHIAMLKAVFDRLRNAGLKLKLQKCQFLCARARYLGVDVSGAGIHTSPDKVSAVQNWPVPRNLKELKSFLGLVTYYRRFIKGFAKISVPLHFLSQKDVPFRWTPACDSAFNCLKRKLVSAPILAYPDFTEHASSFIVDCDASNFGMGACLSQIQEGQERVIAYVSKKLSSAQRNYSVYERELLAVVTSLDEFRHYLLGKSFVLRTDHQALKWLMTLPEPRGRRARWLESLAEFVFEIHHRPGRQHANADALSRSAAILSNVETSELEKSTLSQCNVDINVVNAPTVSEESADCLPLFSPQELAKAQTEDPDLSVVIGWRAPAADHVIAPTEIPGVSRVVKQLWVKKDSLRFKGDVLYLLEDGVFHLVVPQSLQEQAVYSVHDMFGGGHFGFEKTLIKCRSRFYWPGLYTFVRDYVARCSVCSQSSNKTSAGIAPLQPVVAGYPFEIVALDLVGPIPFSDRGHRFILVVIDYFTRWAEAYPLVDATCSCECCNCLCERMGQSLWCSSAIAFRSGNAV